MEESVSERAYAKVNLGLDVLRRRPDGYHELRMIMQTVSLFDEVEIRRTEGAAGGEAGGPEGAVSLVTDAPGIPTDMHNLACRAAALVRERCGLPGGVRIFLRKRIPSEAGLAGGSADAAAVLRGMNRLFSLGLSAEELSEMGLSLGADVPYCVRGGTALAEGIGERLTRLPDLPQCRIRIRKPPFGLSTPGIFRALDREEVRPEDHPDMDRVIAAVRAGNLADAAASIGNLLELPAARERPEILNLKRKFQEEGALGASMSGSGSAVLGIFPPGSGDEALPAETKSGIFPLAREDGGLPPGGPDMPPCREEILPDGTRLFDTVPVPAVMP